MADSKITALTALTAADPANDMIPIVDVSDTPPASGNTKRISINNILACSPSATLASATITGDLTVDTSTLKVDSANNRVGVGTASPSVPLEIRASDNSVLTTGGSANFTQFKAQVDSGVGTSIGSYQNIFGYVGTSSNHYLEIRANNIAQQKIEPLGIFSWFDGAGGTRMTLNATGLGVGAGPGLSGGSRRALTVNSGVGQLSILELAVNSTLTGYLFSNTTQTSLVSQGATYITFDTNSNERMRIDSSGNVGIGVTPSAWNSSTKVLQVGSIGAVENFNNADFNIGNNFFRNSSNALIYSTTKFATAYLQSAANGTHVWYNAPSGTAGNAITFTQAMTLDASGNLLVGKTGSNGTIGNGIINQADGAIWSTMAASTSASNTLLVYSTGAAAYRFYVNLAGTVFATNTTISAISDARLKENVQDIDVGLGAILALKPRKFDWKEGKGKNIKGDRGFIAQEFETVFPNLIDEWKDPAPEGEAPYKSVRQDLIPVLVKAIQELAAEVNALKKA